MINEELKKIREEKKQGKGEFAKSLGVTPMVYGRYESGTLKIPENIETVVKEMKRVMALKSSRPASGKSGRR